METVDKKPELLDSEKPESTEGKSLTIITTPEACPDIITSAIPVTKEKETPLSPSFQAEELTKNDSNEEKSINETEVSVAITPTSPLNNSTLTASPPSPSSLSCPPSEIFPSIHNNESNKNKENSINITDHLDSKTEKLSINKEQEKNLISEEKVAIQPEEISNNKAVEEKRRKSLEKKGNFLRQFRSNSNASGFKKFTASQFMEVWNHYDTDGNGYIEDHELDGFLREFVLSNVKEKDASPEILSEAAMAHFKTTFMDAFDENQDGMIDIQELAEILPTDENFLLLFHLKNPLKSSVEFMRIWKLFDKECKGFIETKELKSFLKHILENQKTSVSEEKLHEYSETILNLFDLNRDGKLQLSEMARLMPVKLNILSKPILKGAGCVTRRDVDRLFKIYDENQNGSIEGEELCGLLKDLMDISKKEYSLDDIEKMRKSIMEEWDYDGDGTISKSELRMFLLQQCKSTTENQEISYKDEEEEDYD